MFSATGALVVVGCGDGADGSESTSGSSSGATSEPLTSSSSGEAPTTSTGEPPTGSSSGESSSSGEDPTTGEDPSTGGDTSTGGLECGEPAAAWATGGTAAMTAQACYPDPFKDGVGACQLICETTAGPCTADTIERQDVSEGFPGLPVRLALRVVDAGTCQPLADARVEIWHSEHTGVYSGNTPNPSCHLDDDDAVNHLCFRGVQTADADGRVDFDTCFPGWYNGRAIHIHFRVSRGDDLHATSQLFFTDELAAEIFATHPEYQQFGAPDTTNQSDSILGKQGDKSVYILDTARMPDGVMLASKVIAVRGSPQDPTCAL